VGDARFDGDEGVLAAARLGLEKEEADVEIRGASAPSERNLLLAVLGWCVIILISDYDCDGGGTVAAVMAASGM
jgi:hypothetical protein